MWCLIGLGNPGPPYHRTRHNLGFDLVDELSRRWKIPIDQAAPYFHFGSGDFRTIPVLLVKPMTFMNRSGEAYRRLLRQPEITPSETLILHDDLHLPLGKIRLRAQGSAGGHNGVTSILEAAGTEAIFRLRIGIEGPDEEWVDYVLSPFTAREREVIDDALPRAADAVETLLFQGIEPAMNLYNR